MLALLFAWIILFVVCLVIGTPVLAVLGEEGRLQRRGDRAVIAVWLGMLVLAWSLLVLALFIPLGPAAGGALTAVLVAASLLMPTTRAHLAALPARPSVLLLAASAVAACATAFLGIDEVSLYDTGLYHYPIIQWLRDHGVVTGLALFHDALGQASTWFALFAPWNGGPLSDHMSNVMTGFVWLVVVLHAILSTTRIMQHRGRIADWFLVVATIFVANRLVGLVLSASADAPILALGCAMLWTVLIIRDAGLDDTAKRTATFDVKMIPFLIGAGALTVKPNAFPLVVIGGLYYLGWPWTAARFAASFVIGVLAMAPVIAAGYRLSGCPLFPSPTLCQDVPWAVDAERLHFTMLKFREFLLRGDKHGPTGVGLENWPSLWIRKQVPGVYFFFATLIAIPFLWRADGRRELPGGRWVVAYAVLAIAFVLVTAPAQRYMVVGYSAAPALLIAWVAHRWWGRFSAADSRPRWVTRALHRAPTIVVTGILAGLTILSSLRFNPRSALTGRGSALDVKGLPWLLPQRMADGPVYPARGIDFDYVTPVDVSKLTERLHSYSLIPQELVSVRCWAAPLPCSPYLTYDDVVLRDPRIGVGGGFVRSSKVAEVR